MALKASRPHGKIFQMEKNPVFLGGSGFASSFWLRVVKKNFIYFCFCSGIVGAQGRVTNALPNVMKAQPHEILLVEDNPADAELTARALDEHELAGAIYHVRDGQEALDYLFSRGLYAYRNADLVPKLILLDLKLPKVSGLEVLRRIKADEKTRRIPVVVVTSSRE